MILLWNKRLNSSNKIRLLYRNKRDFIPAWRLTWLVLICLHRLAEYNVYSEWWIQFGFPVLYNISLKNSSLIKNSSRFLLLISSKIENIRSEKILGFRLFDGLIGHKHDPVDFEIVCLSLYLWVYLWVCLFMTKKLWALHLKIYCTEFYKTINSIGPWYQLILISLWWKSPNNWC